MKTIKELEAEFENAGDWLSVKERINTLKDVLGLIDELKKEHEYCPYFIEILKARITG